jgi:hypothetical protein
MTITYRVFRFAVLSVLMMLSRINYASTCSPAFPLEHGSATGWQGADAAYSIPLADGRDVWIFGDTLYGRQRSIVGNEPRMVHNSLGISTCNAKGEWHLKYVLRHDHAGHPISYFTPTDSDHWYWAMDGFTAHGDLFVTLLCVRRSAASAQNALGFETCGSDLACVSHLVADPHKWSVSISTLVPEGKGAYPSASAVVSGEYVYLFALYERGTRPLLVTRLPLSGLDAPQTHLQYLDREGNWQSGFDPENAKEIMQNGSTELSVRYHKKQQRWFAVLIDPHGFSDRAIVRTAPELIGPWSNGQVLYTVPEMQAASGANKDIFCYAGKEHPESETGQDILFTYTCNTKDVPSLATNGSIYIPQVVRIPIPQSLD